MDTFEIRPAEVSVLPICRADAPKHYQARPQSRFLPKNEPRWRLVLSNLIPSVTSELCAYSSERTNILIL